MNEIWKDISGYEGYYKVSNIGRVLSLKEFNRRGKDRILKLQKGTTGYYKISLYKNKKGSYQYVHRIVAETFLENKEKKPQVNHINGDKLDNRVENLEWVTRNENMKHAYEIGLMPRLTGNRNHNFGKRGEEHSMYGRKHTEESKRKISMNHYDTRRGKSPLAKKVMCVTTGEKFDCIRSAVDAYGINECKIGKCCRGIIKSTGVDLNTGKELVWKYID